MDWSHSPFKSKVYWFSINLYGIHCFTVISFNLLRQFLLPVCVLVWKWIEYLKDKNFYCNFKYFRFPFVKLWSGLCINLCVRDKPWKRSGIQLFIEFVLWYSIEVMPSMQGNGCVRADHVFALGAFALGGLALI